MFLKSSKGPAFILLMVWIAWLGTAIVCLANDHHACCPTQTADWHMDTACSALHVSSLQFNHIELRFVNLILVPDEQFGPLSYNYLIIALEDISPHYYLLTKINHQINAPPQA